MSDKLCENPDLIRLLSQQSPRLLYREISERLKIPPGSVARAAQQLIQQNIIKSRHHQADQRQPTLSQLARLQRIASRRSKDWTWQQVADEEDTTRQAVQQITTKYPEHYAQCLLRTELAPNADDMERLLRVIRRRHQGWSWKRITAEEDITEEAAQMLRTQYPQHYAYWEQRIERT